MKANTLFLLGVSLLFSSLISFSLSSSNCAIFAGQDGSDLAAGALPSSNGFRHGASLNLVAGAQIAPHYIAGFVGNGIDYFIISSPTENVIKKLTFLGDVSTWLGNGTAAYGDGQGTNALFNSPRGISAYHGVIFVADYNNMKVRKISTSGTSSLVHDFSGVMHPLAVYAGSKGVIVLGDNVSGTGQSIAIASTTSTTLTKNATSVFSTGQCNSVTQDGKSNFNVYFGCGTIIKKYDSNLNHLSDYSTTFDQIGSLFMNSNAAYPAPLYVADSSANVVYNFDIVGDTKTLVAGTSGAYNKSKDIFGVTTDCSDVSFNSILSVAASNASTLVMLTKTDIYVQVPSFTPTYPNVHFPSGSYALQPNPLPNLLILDFNSYNATTKILSTTLDFHPEYLFLAGVMDVDFIFVDFIINWWAANSTKIHNVTLLGDKISTLDYDFKNFKSGDSYFIQVKYRTSAGLSSDTTYEFGPQTRLISGPQTINNVGYLSDDGVGSNAQYNLIDHITFDPVKSLFYFADEFECYVRFISLSNGTEQMVAGNGCYQSMIDGNGTNAQFIFPLNTVFDPVHRLLYIQDGGNIAGTSLSSRIRTIDVDHNYNVKTLSIAGLSTTIYTFTLDNLGNLYIYGKDHKWYYITKNGSTYTVTTNHTDTTFAAYGTSEAYWTQGDICANSGASVSTCLVVQDTYSIDSVSASYGPVYTVTTDTFVATELNLGNYIFENIGVDQTGHMFVYSEVMGLGKYLLDQNIIAWFGGDSLSIQSTLYTFQSSLNPTFDPNSHYIESYDYQTAAFAQIDQGHGINTYWECLYPIAFDSNGNVYLFDTYNFRQYTFPPQVPVINSKLTPYCYNLTMSVSKELQGTPQYFTFQDFGCNTTDWNIVSVNTSTLYSYQNPNQVKLVIQPSMSGVRPVHYQIKSSSSNQYIHKVTTQITIINHRPVINNATFTWNYPRTTLTFPNWNILAHCTDQDGDSLSVVQILKMDTRTSSSVVQLNDTVLHFVPENVVLSVLPTGEISLTSPSNTNPVTAGSPLPLSWNENFRFQFQITDGDVLNQYAWGVASINSV